MKHLFIFLLISIPMVWTATWAFDDEAWLIVMGWWILSFANFMADRCAPRNP